MLIKLIKLLTLSLCSAIFFSELSYAEKVEQVRPNVIVILTDDLGYGDLGVHGNTVINTTNIDQMANEGVRFTNAYASASNCTPSRAGLLTGRYPIRSGMAHQVIFVEDTHGLPTEEITIADMLKPLGYQSAIIGKWHLGHTESYWPTKQGFDYYFGLPYSNNQSPLALYRNEVKIEEPVDQKTLTERYTQETIQFIEQNKNQPFFIYLAHTFPHAPLHVSKTFEGKSKASLYGDTVETIDWSTGEILKSLKRMGLDENTLVIFTSDNGPYQGGNTANLRGTKGTPWEGGYRVPFIARWPKKIQEGIETDAMTMNIDILPTIQGMTGAKLPDKHVIDGKDIMPVLKGQKTSPHEKLYFFSDEKIAAVRTPNWKVMLRARYRGIDRWLPEHDVHLLFDMNKDSLEQYSVAQNHPQVWKQMMKHYEEGVDSLQSLALHIKKIEKK